ncbi:MAG: amino acid ABC transporter permease [Deltaproteobacteria bacterium]|jgi:arginine/ornithine transport system permease protein|uniref:ABC transmembrane type-1 domain-containing protein n=1 Tax=marine metagenome TaxID=408172 RepID=A0A381SKR8_9ZZZZ|nr:amino acid ABC transporter permease [Deltaproteobacteria bacterium]MDP6307776.1 ABC transporter permease [SAR324 cluster bacterium]MAF54534.1 amino acid ABC transporter permease [Deltaproteobacteria bacterium]MDP6487375.1 ABC transporter permease [SAR324 cluster bacterium]MDP7170475.1 ABC transporter permease [SAR324 cluster bacterium]|tara:strand:+ start:757 stop:1449 length:693 start_codon:yes stop_codon:yes gene_type:complete
MDYNVIINNLPLYLNGLLVTIQLVVIALVSGFGLAVPLALMAVSKISILRYSAKAYIYFFRGTPLLVQMFLLYYGMGQFEAIRESVLWILFKEAYWSAIIAFALNTAGYTAEILRGAIEQTPFGEIEAANASGMSKSTLYRRIILPGSFRRALPAYGNEVIFMLHGSALAGVITIVDLFGAAKIVNSRYFVPFESFITAGFFYLCCTFCIIWFFKWVEKHWYVHLRPRTS